MVISLLLWCTGTVFYLVWSVASQEKLVLKYHIVTADLIALITNRANHPYKTISGTIETKDQIEELCMQSVTSDYIFHVYPPENKNATFPGRPEKLVQLQINHIKSHFSQNEKIIPVKRQVILPELPIEELDTITCYSTTIGPMGAWVLLDINDRGRYYVFYKSSSNYLKLTGRLEDAPEVDVDCNVQTSLEKKFGSSLRISNGFFPYDFCRAHQFYHFGACAQVAKFMNLHDSKYKKHFIYIYEKERDICVRNGAIEYKSKVYDRVYEVLDNHKLGIMPCAVNTDWSNPQFYIFNDQFEKNVLYILKRVRPNVEPPTFFVEMRIKGVTSVNMHSPRFERLIIEELTQV